MMDDKVTAELVRSLYAELHAKDAQLAERDVRIHQLEREKQGLDVELRRMAADRTYVVA